MNETPLVHITIYKPNVNPTEFAYKSQAGESHLLVAFSLRGLGKRFTAPHVSFGKGPLGIGINKHANKHPLLGALKHDTAGRYLNARLG